MPIPLHQYKVQGLRASVRPGPTSRCDVLGGAKKAFPGKRDFVLLLDGEPLLHAPAARRSMANFNISVLPGWPKYSAELNPQENVWPIAERYLRDKLEKDGDSFETFQKNVEKAVHMYPSPGKLVGSMASRVKECLDKGGDPLRK